MWGRGAVDMKDFDAMLLSVVRARARAGRVPDRPVVLCFTADEEAGGHKGAEHLMREHRDELEGCTEAVGEVGGFSTTVRGRRMYLIEAAEKGMAWMKLTARGRAGHGSMINRDNAVTELAAAVARIGTHEWPVRLTPTMKTLLAAVAELAGTEATPENAEALVQEFGGATRMLGAVLRNTTNPTMLGAGYKVNVIPTEATAHVDGRFLPGFEDEFFATLAELCGENVSIEYVSRQQPWETPYDGDLVDAMSRSILAEDPDAIVAPYLMSGGTDAKHFNRLGLRSYGFAPLRLPDDLDFTALFHGVDERVPVDALEPRRRGSPPGAPPASATPPAGTPSPTGSGPGTRSCAPPSARCARGCPTTTSSCASPSTSRGPLGRGDRQRLLRRPADGHRLPADLRARALSTQGHGRPLDGGGADPRRRPGRCRPGLHAVAEHRAHVRAALTSGPPRGVSASGSPEQLEHEQEDVEGVEIDGQGDQRDVPVPGAAEPPEVVDRQARRTPRGRRCTR